MTLKYAKIYMYGNKEKSKQFSLINYQYAQDVASYETT